MENSVCRNSICRSSQGTTIGNGSPPLIQSDFSNYVWVEHAFGAALIIISHELSYSNASRASSDVGMVCKKQDRDESLTWCSRMDDRKSFRGFMHDMIRRTFTSSSAFHMVKLYDILYVG